MSQTNAANTVNLYRQLGIATVGRVGVTFNRDKGQWEVNARIRMTSGNLRDGTLATFATSAEAVEFERLWN